MHFLVPHLVNVQRSCVSTRVSSSLCRSVLQLRRFGSNNAIAKGQSHQRQYTLPLSIQKNIQSHKRPLVLSPFVQNQNSRCYGRCGYGSLLLQARSVHGDTGSKPDGDAKTPALPQLMEYPTVMWPRFVNSIRNWFLTHFVIRAYFDHDFSIQDFMKGAQEAISLVATKMSKGEFDDLDGLVDASVLKELRNTVSTFSVFQQDLLRVATEDVFFSFPYQIGIIIPDGPSFSTDSDKYMETGEGRSRPPQIRHVEITVVLHVLRGMDELQKKGETGSNFNLIDFTKDETNKYKVMVCNYRFFRDFTEGKDPTWIINMVNHFLPAEMNR